jgi:ATP synthase F1 epsilon subunit
MLVDCDVFDVVYPAHDGLCGVMSRHAPMLSKLGMGIVTFNDFQNQPQYLYIEGGFARISENKVRLLARRVVLAGEISKAQAESQLRHAEVMTTANPFEIKARQKAIQRSKFLIKLADLTR